MNTSSATSLLLLSTLLLAACSTPPRETAQAKPANLAAQPSNKVNLRKGMADPEIRAAWGEPQAVHAGKDKNETILVYHFDVMTTQQMVAAAMTEVPAFDPITGEARTVLEPKLTPQNVTVTQTIVLRLVDGKLVNWARKLGEERKFN